MGYYFFFYKSPPPTPEQKAEYRRMIREETYKQARQCEKNLDDMYRLSPDTIGKYYRAVKRKCWDEWNDLRDLPDD
jgi:hypothetical protein